MALNLDDYWNGLEDEEEKAHDLLIAEEKQEELEKQQRKENRQEIFSGLASTFSSVLTTAVTAWGSGVFTPTNSGVEDTTGMDTDQESDGHDDKGSGSNTLMIVVAAIIVVGIFFFVRKK